MPKFTTSERMLIQNIVCNLTIKRIPDNEIIKETNTRRHEILLQGPISLRAQQMEEKVRELIEDSEMPKRSYMNLKLPA